MQIMTLKDMLDQLRMEARLSTNVAHGAHLTNSHVALLRRVQQELYDAYEWPALRTVQTVKVPAGARYKAYPEQVPFEGISKVYAKAPDGRFAELRYGIEVEHLNQYDSDNGARNSTVWRWQNYLSPEAETLNQNMFEVWPIPDRDTEFRFEAKRALFPLTNPETDTSTLDGPLIVLHAAVEILAAQKAEDVPVKLQKAQQRFDNLKRRQSAPDTRRVNMGRRTSHRALRPGLDYIP